MKMTNLIDKLAKLYNDKVVRLQGILMSIVSHRVSVHLLAMTEYTTCYRNEIESNYNFSSSE
jgi:hypothetical protein